MADRAELSVEKALGTQKLLASNKVNVDALIVNVGKSADASAESAKNILELEERTRRIDKIVDAIVMVTVQTKMLAVNGNVEAARAGEYGRGFSVVAGDIRSLANESSENADKIKDLVKNVQTQIAKVAGDIELAGNKGRAEVERAKVSTREPRSDRERIRRGGERTSAKSPRDRARLPQDSNRRARPASRSPPRPRKRRAPRPKRPAPPSRR